VYNIINIEAYNIINMSTDNSTTATGSIVGTKQGTFCIGYNSTCLHEGAIVLGSNIASVESREVRSNKWHLFDDGTIQFDDGPRIEFALLQFMPGIIEDLYGPDGIMCRINAEKYKSFQTHLQDKKA
jgi:hypothetical protein